MTGTLALHLYLLGPLQLIWDEEPLPLPRSSGAKSLLAYLAFHHHKDLPRGFLAGLFWGNKPEATARRALSQSLWQIRHTLGPASDRLKAGRNTVTFLLHPNDRLDVQAFEEHIASAREKLSVSDSHVHLSQAVAVYRGDLLEGCYEDWVLVERERLRELYLQALSGLISWHRQRGEYEQALVYARRLTSADPLREAGHRDVMLLYHLLKRDRAALAQYESLRRDLKRELGLEPTRATTELYREIAASLANAPISHLPLPPPPPIQDLSKLPFVGRRQERAALLEAIHATERGYGGAVLIEGDAGVGKSRLAEEGIAEARWRGFQVGVGKADPMSKPAPYQLLRSALEPLLTPLRLAQLAELADPRWLSALTPILPVLSSSMDNLPPLPQLPPRQEQQRLGEALRLILESLSEIAPVLLLLEDIHWAEESSLALLARLVAPLAGMRSLVILTARPNEVSERPAVQAALEEISLSTHLMKIQLKVFTRPETCDLVSRALGVRKGDPKATAFARRLQRETGGNPLFMVETLKALQERGTLRVKENGAWEFPSTEQPLPIPRSVQDLIRMQLIRLAPALRRDLEIVAVLGEDADFATVSRLDAGKTSSLVSALGEMVRRGYLVEDGEHYRFGHDLVRDGVYGQISPQRRRELHRRAAEVLESLHPNRLESLALHFAEGGVPDKALIYALRSGKAAEKVYDYETALTHYRRAVELAQEPAQRWEALSRLEHTLDTLGRKEEAAKTLEEMLALTDSMDAPRQRGRTLYRLARNEAESGNPVRALKILKETERLVRSAGMRDMEAWVLREVAMAHWRRGEAALCQEAALKALAMFQESGDQMGTKEVLSVLLRLHLGLTGDYRQALRYSLERKHIAHEEGDALGEAICGGNISVILALLGDYAQAQDKLKPALDFVRKVGDRYSEGAFLIFQSINLRGLGKLQPAYESAAQALELCRQSRNPNFEIEALGVLGLIEMDRGRYHEAMGWFQRAVEMCGEHHQRADQALQMSHLALAHARLGAHTRARRISDRATSIMEEEPDQHDRLKTGHFERAQILNAAPGTRPSEVRKHIELAHHHLQIVANRIGDPLLRSTFLENVVENRSILLSHRLGRVVPPTLRRSTRLPAATAPTGRPLRNDEWVSVEWTVSVPEDGEIRGKSERRRHVILRLLREAQEQGAAPTVEDLATVLGVSRATIKRDLAALRTAGHTVRTRGSRSW